VDEFHERVIRLTVGAMNGCKHFYLEYGYDTLILWDDELADESKVIEKINEFMVGKF